MPKETEKHSKKRFLLHSPLDSPSKRHQEVKKIFESEGVAVIVSSEHEVQNETKRENIHSQTVSQTKRTRKTNEMKTKRAFLSPFLLLHFVFNWKFLSNDDEEKRGRSERQDHNSQEDKTTETETEKKNHRNET